MPAKLTRKTLTEKHFRALRGRSRGLTFAEIGKSEGASESTIQQRFRAIKPFLHPLTLARLDPDHTPKLVALRLSGKTLSQIEAQTGIDRSTVHKLLERAGAGMDKEAAEKLAVGGTRASPSRVTRIANRQRAINAFFEEMDRFSNPYGAMKRAAQLAGLGRWVNLVHHLTRAGVNWQAEVRRRRLALALRVAETMHLPREEASKVIGIDRSTLDTYRRKVRRTQLPVGVAADLPEEAALKTIFEKIRRGQITLPGRIKQFEIRHLEAIHETRRLDAKPRAKKVSIHVPEIEVTIDTIRAFRRQFAKLPPLQQVIVARQFGISMSHSEQAILEASILSSEEKANELQAAYATLEQHPLVKKLL